MKEIKVSASKEYKILISSERALLRSFIEENSINGIYIITDEHVYDKHTEFINSLSETTLGIMILKPGENSKNLENVAKIYRALSSLEINKNTSIVSIGGGVVGDISGFVASTFMRGVGLIHVPTSLMAQCDSSIGGKTGFNLEGIKNIIGTFYQPDLVFTDVDFLNTLNVKEYKNGIAEILKYGYVCDEKLFDFIENNREAIRNRDKDILISVIYSCASIKGHFVEVDERDSKHRQILNFGHTIGHGIESACGFYYSHGEAVALGMLVESEIGVKMGLTPYENHERLLSLIKYFELPYILDNRKIDLDGVLKFITKDKKKTSERIKFVLPHKLGHAIITTDVEKDKVVQIMGEMAGF